MIIPAHTLPRVRRIVSPPRVAVAQHVENYKGVTYNYKVHTENSLKVTPLQTEIQKKIVPKFSSKLIYKGVAMKIHDLCDLNISQASSPKKTDT